MPAAREQVGMPRVKVSADCPPMALCASLLLPSSGTSLNWPVLLSCWYHFCVEGW